jgi:hypothetical protein
LLAENVLLPESRWPREPIALSYAELCRSEQVDRRAEAWLEGCPFGLRRTG